MRNRITPMIIAALLAITALAAAWHLNTRTETESGALTVAYSDSTIILHINNLPMTDIRGEIVNGIGETRVIVAKGITLADVLKTVSIQSFECIAVTASDEYSAELFPTDLPNANFILQEDGSLQLIVFGDPNSKRNVSNAVRMEVQ